MHILHVLDHSLPLHSGYAFRSRNILKAQAKRGWEPEVVTSPKHQESWKSKWEPEETIDGFRHYRTPLDSPKSVRGYYEIQLIRALCRRLDEVVSISRPDIIHAHSPVLNAIPALRVGRRHNIPVVYEIRAFWEDAGVDQGSYRDGSVKYRFVRMLETNACRRADHVIVISEGLNRELLSRGIEGNKVSIVRNGIQIEDFRGGVPDTGTAARFGLDGRSIIGFFGSFYRYEGLDLLLDAFALLTDKRADCSLLLAGGGEMEKSLKEKAQKLKLADRIVFPGRIAHEQIPEVYAVADILVYPRLSMRLTDIVTPLKPLEAMAMGKAVIASDVGGHRELVEDGETGVLFPAGDVGALASAMERLLADTQARIDLGQRAKTWVSQNRTWEKTTALYGDVYSTILSGRDHS